MSEGMELLETLVHGMKEKVVYWRRYLHERPEMSFQEHHTSQFVYETLQTFSGLSVSRPTKTSVMARLIGDLPGGVLALRADMDALPIQEENSFPFVSQVPGVMHACGHDGHTAILLAAASVLSQIRHIVPGEVRFIFQHAEELYPGGAEAMIAAGVMAGVDKVVGAHLWASLGVGQVAVTAGPMMAAPDTFKITVFGKGGHAAEPQGTVDPIAIGAQIVTNLQQIVSRTLDPFLPLVIAVTKFNAGTANNVIPELATLAGTVRSFDPQLREAVPEQMERIVKGICAAHMAECQFEFKRGYRPVINDARVASMLENSLKSALGENSVVKAIPTMAGEDFSAYQQLAPGAFFFIGAGNPGKGITFPHHHPCFTVDEDALLIGVKAYVRVALDLGRQTI